MTTINLENGKTVKVVSASEINNTLTPEDIDMDNRAKEAVRVAIERTTFLKKPVGKYDPVTKRAYLEYPNGEKKYVD